MSLSNYRWQHCSHELQLIMCYRPQLKCVPLKVLIRTKPGVRSTQVSETKERGRQHRLVASLSAKVLWFARCEWLRDERPLKASHITRYRYKIIYGLYRKTYNPMSELPTIWHGVVTMTSSLIVISFLTWTSNSSFWEIFQSSLLVFFILDLEPST